MSLDPAIQSTIDHLALLTRKRDKLEAAIDQAIDVLASQVGRAELDGSDLVELCEWASRARSKDERGHALPRGPVRVVPRLAEALGLTEHEMRALARRAVIRAKAPAGTVAEGSYPVDKQWTPARGVPCVYMLLADGRIVYIGRSEQVRVRLKAHWKQKDRDGGKPDIDGWRLVACDDLESSKRLESDLIAHYSPRYNRAGNRYRNVA